MKARMDFNWCDETKNEKGELVEERYYQNKVLWKKVLYWEGKDKVPEEKIFYFDDGKTIRKRIIYDEDGYSIMKIGYRLNGQTEEVEHLG